MRTQCRSQEDEDVLRELSQFDAWIGPSIKFERMCYIQDSQKIPPAPPRYFMEVSSPCTIAPALYPGSTYVL